MKKIITIIPLISCIVFVACNSNPTDKDDNSFDKELQLNIDYINTHQLPNQANEIFWKDSISFDREWRVVWQYFSLHVPEESKAFYRTLFQNNDLARDLLKTEDMSFYVKNHLSMAVEVKFTNGETVAKVLIPWDEMEITNNHVPSSKELADRIYSNLALSFAAITPFTIDECTTVTKADYDISIPEFTIEWLVDDYCFSNASENAIREVMRDYIIQIIRKNHKEITDLEKQYEGVSDFRRSSYPITVTLICRSLCGKILRESMLSSQIAL